jgi:hypothetical protein
MAARSCILVVLALLAWGALLQAQERPAPEMPNQTGRLLEAMTQRVARLKMKFSEGNGQTDLRLTKSPVLRTGDPSRNIDDGSVWLWLDGKQPVAALCVWVRRGIWYSENTTLSDDALEVTGWPNGTWQPPAEVRNWLVLEESVSESPLARQRTMREISRQFTASEFYRGQTFELRLQPRPSHTYSAPERGIIEGALFTFVNATDPEVFMQIEARENAGAKRWQVAFARLSSAALTVRQAEKEIWTVPAPESRRPQFDTGYFTVREAKAKR